MTIYLHEGDLPQDVQFQGDIAIDTETLGLNLQRDRLCLVQLSDGCGNEHLVRFSADYIEKNGYKAPRLQSLLSDSNRLKIFHFGRFDIAMLEKYLEIRMASVYCTRIASRLVRTYTDRHGLKDLVRELLGVELSKQQQSSDWGSIDLTQAQLEYAACDVRYLHGIKRILDERLKREKRLELAQACFDFLPSRARLDLAGWADVDLFVHNV